MSKYEIVSSGPVYLSKRTSEYGICVLFKSSSDTGKECFLSLPGGYQQSKTGETSSHCNNGISCSAMPAFRNCFEYASVGKR
jgi:hypothetical protein